MVGGGRLKSIIGGGMGKDYSNTVLGDVCTVFRRCCFCKCKGDLSRVAVGAYTGHDWYYFHDKCLKIVSDNPERNEKLIDMALEIQTEIFNIGEWARSRKKQLVSTVSKLKEMNQKNRAI